MSEREKSFKFGASNVDELRRKKAEHTVKLRKEKRNEKLLEKRALGGSLNLDMLDNLGGPKLSNLPAPDIEDLPKYVQYVNGSTQEDLQIGATQIRRLLSSSKTQPPLEAVIATGVVSRLVDLMKLDDDKLRVECAWTLTNLASGTSKQTSIVVEAGSVPVFVSLLNDKPSVAEQCMWALGNIAGDSPQLRDFTFNNGILDPLMRLLESSYNAYVMAIKMGHEPAKDAITMMRTCTWTLSNLSRGKTPPADLKMLLPTLPLLAKMITVEDKDTLADACWACSFISDLTNGVSVVLQYGMSKRLVNLLTYPSPDVVSPTLRAIGNIVAGDDSQTQQIISDGALPCLHSLLMDTKAHIRKEACWALSNITAGTPQQVTHVLEAGIMPDLMKLLVNDMEPRVRKEASWAVANAAHTGQDAVIMYLVELDVIKALCNVLTLSVDAKTLCVILLALKKILHAGTRLPLVQGQNQFAIKLEECGGVETIENLRHHQNIKVYERASRVLKYVQNDEEDVMVGDNIAPEQTENSYKFGVDSSAPTSGFQF